jgi:Restriction endonuclease BglII
MRLAAEYSHLNGLEFLLVHHPQRWNEIRDVIAEVDAERCRTKESKERRKAGRGLLYSPISMNNAMRGAFKGRDWAEQRTSYWVTEDVSLIRRTINLKANHQKAEIEAAGHRGDWLLQPNRFR